MSRSKVAQANNVEKEVLLTGQSEVVEMTLNTESALTSGLLIQRLTELYEDPIVATVRETVSNALDAVTKAHAGKRPEVHITTPTTLNPILTIRDNGVGMTYEDLKNVYAKYGASSKADDMSQIGAYGLGAKSPLSYGSEFTVASVKDGEKTIIIVAKEEVTNYMKIVDSSPTDEATGTKVIIPVNSGDIAAFQEQVDKYLENPIDKDVDLYINNQLVNADKYTVITDELVIYKGSNGETVEARMWVDTEEIVNLLSHYDDDRLQSSLKYLIGGWAYESPAGRKQGYHRSLSSGIIIELKSGIVGFNSARDAILENKRYEVLEKRIIDYMRSNDFMDVVVKAINKMPLDEFKKTLGTLLRLRDELLTIVNGKGYFREGNRSHYRAGFMKVMHPVTFDMLTHEETGFNLNKVLSNIPKKDSITFVSRERKTSYNQTVSNSIMSSKFTGYDLFVPSNVSNINEMTSKMFSKSESSHELGVLLVTMSKIAFSDGIEKERFTIVTDVETDEDISKLKSNRKSIVRMRNKDKLTLEYNSYVVYTSLTKMEVNNMIEDVELDELDLLVEDVEGIVELVKEFRKNVKPVKRAITDKLSTKLTLYKDGALRYAKYSDIDEDSVNLVVVKYESHMDSHRAKLMKTWYANKHNYDLDEVNVYVSTGSHKVTDLKLLKDIGDVMRCPLSDHVATSRFYQDEVRNRLVGEHAILDDEEDLEAKSFIRLLSNVADATPEAVIEHIEEVVANAREIAEASGTQLDKVESDFLDRLRNIKSDSFPDKSYYNTWKLYSDTPINHLLSKLNEEQAGLVQDIAVLMSGELIKRNSLNYYRRGRSAQFDMSLEEVENVYDINSELPSAFLKLKKVQTEAYIEYVRDIITRMSTVNFG